MKTEGHCVEGGFVDGVSHVYAVGCSKVKAIRYTARLTKTYELRFGGDLCLDWGLKEPTFMNCHMQRGNQITLYNPVLKVI